MDVQRASDLSTERFLQDFVAANRPVVVTDALRDTDLAGKWSPAYLEANYGQELVQVYNDYFDLTDITTLTRYLHEHFGRAQPSRNVPYVRWYSKLRDVDFCWADDALEKMGPNWVTPSFVPRTDFVLPYAPPPRALDPRADRFPARGLFISGKGARTGLHIDPWASDAVLCQLYGEKSWTMYAPDQGKFLTDGVEVVDPDEPDRAKFPRFEEATPTLQFEQRPGDAVYVPHGWFHTVRSVTDSISLTWNFVHKINEKEFRAWLGGEVRTEDMEIVQFFTRGPHIEESPASGRVP